jgi:hypothetical protein
VGRPIDWQPLADNDPVPGDPVAVADLARHYRRTAEAIQAAAAGLRKIIAPATGLVGKSVDGFRDDATQVADSIEKAHGRYAAAGHALAGYTPVLDHAQARSLEARAAAIQAQADLHDATRRANGPPPDGADPLSVDAAKASAERDATDAEDRLAIARGKLAEATADRDRAAERAAQAINDIIDHDGLRDGWWDNWGAKLTNIVADVAGTIATVCGILSLVVGWIPIVGQALAAVLGTIALVASVISLIANLALYLTGKGDLIDVVFDAISVATFGLGRVASNAAKVSYRGMRGAARITAGRAASRPLPGQTSQALLKDLAKGTAGMRRVAARRAMKFADRQGVVPPLAAIWGSLRSTGPEFTSGVRTLQGADWGNVVRNLPGDFRTTFAGTSDDGFRAFFSKLYGDPGGADYAIGHRALADAIGTDAKVAKHATRAVVQHFGQIGSSLTGSGVDGYQAYKNVSGLLSNDPTPSARLNLPTTTGVL